MQTFSGSKTDAAQYVADTVLNLENDSQLITIITPDLSGVCSVSTATDMSLDDIVKALGQACYDKLTSI